jgi:NAD(P)-dependent dehydrogenase (short-subunit alcohol dehydrogenase family)
MTQKIVVFGADSDIAKSFIIKAREENYSIFSISRKHDSGYPVEDISNFEQVEQAMQSAVENLGEINGVVNFCGSILLKPAHLTSFDDYIKTINSSLTTSFAITRAAAKFVKQNCSVVFIGSAAANIGLANHEAISAAKGGVISLAKSAAATYASKGIRFNVINPGLIDTKLTSRIIQNPESLKYSLSMHASERPGSVEDIANMVMFLLSPHNKWITGSAFDIDCGLSSVKIKR